MLEPLGNLIRRWRADPRPATTLALCQGLAELGETTRSAPPAGWPQYVAFCNEVGRVVGERFALDLDVLLAAGRMHLAAGATWDAQSATLQAAKIAPDEPRAWSLLGEALLRRGDASRAARSLDRAAAAGVRFDPQLLDLAHGLAMATHATREQIADEVARQLGYAALPAPPGAPSMPPAATSTPPPAHAVAIPRAAGVPRPAGPTPSRPEVPRASSSEDEPGEATVRHEFDRDELYALLRASDGAQAAADDPRASEALARLQARVAQSSRSAERASAELDDSHTSQFSAGALASSPLVPRAPLSSGSSDAFTLIRRAVDDDTTTESENIPTTVAAIPGVREALRAAGISVPPRSSAGSMESIPTLARQLAPRSPDHHHHPMVEDATTDHPPYRDSLTSDGEPFPMRQVDPIVVPRALQPGPSPVARVIVDPPGREGPKTGAPPAVPLPTGTVGATRDPGLPGLLDDSQHSAPLPLPPPAPEPPVGLEDTQRRKKPGRRRVLGWLVGLAAASTAGTFGFRAWQRRQAIADDGAAKQEIEASRAALYAGDARKARTLAEHALELSPKSADAARAIVDARALDVLDGGVAPDAAVDVVTSARRLGVEGVGLAVATLVAAVGARNAEHTRSLVDQHARQEVGDGDAVYQLALGAAHDLLADAAAVEAYAAARKAAPAFSSATIRHVRALIFAGRAGEAKTAHASSGEAKLAKKVDNALAMLLLRAEHPERWPEKDARIDRDDVGDLPRPLRAIGAALALVPPDEKGASSMGLDAALDDADCPGALLLCGQLALAARDLDSALQAGERAATMAPTWTPAHALKARVFLLRGQLEQALALEPSLPPTVSAELRAIAAYETGDPEALAEAESRAVEKGASKWPALALALGRLRSASKRPGPADSDGLIAEGVPWADVLAVDLALDAGELPRANRISKGWGDKPDPARALRVARLRRIEGDLPGAAKALLAAGDKKWAKLEAVLLAAESKAERKKTIGLLEEQIAGMKRVKSVPGDLGELAPFALAYLRGREGAFQAAKSALGKSKVLTTGPLEARALTLLGLAASRDTGQAEPLAGLVELLRGRPEIVWAGVMLGTLPPTKMPKGMK